jgi:hypothetical protein
MQITTEQPPKPRGTWQQTCRQIGEKNAKTYRRMVRTALAAIADLNLREGDTISATAIFLALVDVSGSSAGADRATVRETVNDAFQLLVDQGIASPVMTKGLRPTTLFDFHGNFGPEHVASVLGWNGRDETLLRKEND